ncbi:MAG: hypothetical protein ACI86X_002342 [Moritella sp.]|jgi:hypothetical protein
MTVIKSCKQLVEEATTKIQTLSMEEAKEKLGLSDLLFVDIRDTRRTRA